MAKSALLKFTRFAVATMFVVSTNLCFFDCYVLASDGHQGTVPASSHCHGQGDSHHGSSNESSPQDDSVCCQTSHTFVEVSPFSLPTLKLLALEMPGVPTSSYQALGTIVTAALAPTGADPPSLFQSYTTSSLISAPNAPPALSFS